MASEMIDKIFEAEKNAAKEIENAQNKAFEIVEKAKADAKDFENKTQGDTAAQIEKAQLSANETAQKIFDEKMVCAKNDADALCESVKSKKQTALESVVEIITLG